MHLAGRSVLSVNRHAIPNLVVQHIEGGFEGLAHVAGHQVRFIRRMRRVGQLQRQTQHLGVNANAGRRNLGVDGLGNEVVCASAVASVEEARNSHRHPARRGFGDQRRARLPMRVTTI